MSGTGLECGQAPGGALQGEIDAEPGAHRSDRRRNAVTFKDDARLKDKWQEKLYLEEEIRTKANFEEIIGESPALKRALKHMASWRHRFTFDWARPPGKDSRRAFRT